MTATVQKGAKTGDVSFLPVFFVYDSRSGSTFLAREMMRRLDGLLVTTEIGFDTMLRRAAVNNNQTDWSPLIPKMYHKDFLNLPFGANRLNALIDGKTAAPAILAVLSELRRLSDRKDASCIIVKNGTHVKYLQTFSKLFGREFRVLHIVRDPRAVIASKLVTERPYVPGQVMAWAGSFFAALQWRSYIGKIKSFTKDGFSPIEIRYEDLVQSPAATVEGIGKELDLKTSDKAREYLVPEKEQAIHTLAAGPASEERITAWKKTLKSRDKIIIETLTAREMNRLGYRPDRDYSQLQMITAILSGAAESTFLILAEIIKRTMSRLWKSR